MSTGATIAVFGEALVDDFGSDQVAGGAPFNVARNLAAFGADVLMITRIGADGNGELVMSEFERFGLVHRGLQHDCLRQTGRVRVERGAGDHRFVIEPDQAYDHIEAGPALEARDAAAPSIIYFGTLAQRGQCSRATLGQLLSGSNALRYLDLNIREGHAERHCIFNSLHLADLLKVNETELQDLLDWYVPGRPRIEAIGNDSLRRACMGLMQTFSLAAMIVTLGARGALYAGIDGLWIYERGPPAATPLVDTVGAGDAFSSVFLLGHLRGWPVDVTLVRANAFAGAVCGLTGAVSPDREFYRRWLNCMN